MRYFEHISLDLIRICYAVVKSGSMTRAAETLHVTQPAVSHAIAELEEKLGFPLFIRKGRSLVLTEEGRAVEEAGKKIHSYLLETEDRLTSLRSLSEGKLTIAVPFFQLHTYLLPYIARFHQVHPNIHFKVIIENRRPELFEHLAREEVDLVFMAVPTEDILSDWMGSKTVARFRYCFMANPEVYGNLKGYRLTLEELNEFPILILRPENNTRDFLEKIFEGRSLAMNIGFEGDTLFGVEDFARAGYGIAATIRQVPNGELEPKELMEIKTDLPKNIGRYSLLWDSKKSLSLPAESFLGMFKKL